ncbi:MAG TPA: cupin domain-containing protein [Dongiaceae bacterium]|jgi:quercetin dioxygenase-like cupin family protein|nr:cupin domain-containing protein [Dongiaceae bacterium]
MRDTATLPNPGSSTARFMGAAIALALVVGAALYATATPRRDPANASLIQAAGTRPTAHTISSDALPHVAGKRITTMVIEFPPGGFSPPHHHGGSVTVYVLHGTIRSQLEGGPAIVYTEGQTFFEPPGIIHLLAENISATETARILAVFVADEGATLTTYHE